VELSSFFFLVQKKKKKKCLQTHTIESLLTTNTPWKERFVLFTYHRQV
jgi:hypothetical protein